MNEENQISYYAVIPATIRYDNRLKPSEKLMYGEITSLTNKNGYCYAKNKYFADLYKVNAHTVSRWISHLQELGYIHLELIRNMNKEIKQRRIYIRDGPYVQKNTYPYELKSTYPMYQKVQDNNKDEMIDRLFNYFIRKEKEIPEEIKDLDLNEIFQLLEKFEVLYNEEQIKNFTEYNISKIKIIIYTLIELLKCNRKCVLYKMNREKIFRLYDKCKNRENEINDFIDYYIATINNELDK